MYSTKGPELYDQVGVYDSSEHGSGGLGKLNGVSPAFEAEPYNPMRWPISEEPIAHEFEPSLPIPGEIPIFAPKQEESKPVKAPVRKRTTNTKG